jgi:hypothetical protein
MAYKIKIKHNISGKTIPLTLKYDDPSLNLKVIPITVSSTYKEFNLWNISNIDASKVKIVEDNVVDGNTVYEIKSFTPTINGESGGSSSSGSGSTIFSMVNPDSTRVFTMVENILWYFLMPSTNQVLSFSFSIP